MEKKEESSIFDMYKNNVEYNYILKGKLEFTLGAENEDDENYRPSEEQYEQGIQDLEENMVKDLFDEDYLKMLFSELGVGRVYPKLDKFDNTIEVTFGISTIQAEEPVTIDILKEDVIEYMDNICTNVESVNVTGIRYGDGEGNDTEPCTIYLKQKGTKDDIKVEVIKEPQKLKTEMIAMDKQLVSEGKLTFIKENSIIEYILNDDGIVEYYNNNKLENTKPFSKLNIIRECKSVIQEGYSLCIETTDIDTKGIKTNLEQGIEKVNELQNLKDELENKVETLVNESTKPENTNIEIKDISDFPSTENTSKKLCINDIKDLVNISELLTEEQIYLIEYNICSMDELDDGIRDLFYLTGIVDPEEEFISIEDYISNLLNEGVTK